MKRHRISDKQWQRLTGIIELPNAARRDIEGQIDWHLSALHGSAWRRKFESMCNAARRLSERVDALRPEEIADLIDLAEPANADRVARDRFSEELKCWAFHFEQLSKARGKTIPDRNRQFIRAVAAIIQCHTGHLTVRATKNPHALKPFLETLCKIAGLNIGPGSIDEALRKRIRERQQRRGEKLN